MKFAFIKANSSDFPVKKMCSVLDVSRSGYYEWCVREPGVRAIEEEKLLNDIRHEFTESRCLYGSPRITRELNDSREPGERVGENRVARLMREHGISAKNPRQFRVQTTDSDHDFPVSPNILGQNFTADKPGTVFLSDITYIPVDDSWMYLCAVMDLFNREIVGWSLAHHMRTEMVLEAFHQAVGRRKPEPGAIFHSDRGSQYASKKFRKELKKQKMISSMSRKGNCYDNAPMESFFHTLKTEEVYRNQYKTAREARINLFDYIDGFYNRKRRHSSLDYLSPSKFLEIQAA